MSCAFVESCSSQEETKKRQTSIDSNNNLHLRSVFSEQLNLSLPHTEEEHVKTRFRKTEPLNHRVPGWVHLVNAIYKVLVQIIYISKVVLVWILEAHPAPGPSQPDSSSPFSWMISRWCACLWMFSQINWIHLRTHTKMHLISFDSHFIIVLSTFILAVIKVYLPKFFFFFCRTGLDFEVLINCLEKIWKVTKNKGSVCDCNLVSQHS